MQGVLSLEGPKDTIKLYLGLRWRFSRAVFGKSMILSLNTRVLDLELCHKRPYLWYIGHPR